MKGSYSHGHWWSMARSTLSKHQVMSIGSRSRQPPFARHRSSMSESLPRVAQPSLWQSLIPKPLRKSPGNRSAPKKERSKEWNPATFYIAIFTLIGSNAINLIALRRDFVNFSHQADQQISKLKRVIELVQKGEEVDVEAMLGTGNPQKEQEWEDILKELELATPAKEAIGENESLNKTPRDSTEAELLSEDKKSSPSKMVQPNATTKSRPAGFY